MISKFVYNTKMAQIYKKTTLRLPHVTDGVDFVVKITAQDMFMPTLASMAKANVAITRRGNAESRSRSLRV